LSCSVLSLACWLRFASVVTNELGVSDKPSCFIRIMQYQSSFSQKRTIHTTGHVPEHAWHVIVTSYWSTASTRGLTHDQEQGSRQHHVCVKGYVLAHIQEWRQQVHTHLKNMICENRTSLEANYHSFGSSFADDQDWVHLGKAGDCFNSNSPGFLCCSPAGLPESDRGCWLVEILLWLLLLCCWFEVFLLFVEPVAALSCCIASCTASSALATSGLALTSATFWEEPDHLQHNCK